MFGVFEGSKLALFRPTLGVREAWDSAGEVWDTEKEKSDEKFVRDVEDAALVMLAGCAAGTAFEALTALTTSTATATTTATAATATGTGTVAGKVASFAESMRAKWVGFAAPASAAEAFSVLRAMNGVAARATLPYALGFFVVSWGRVEIGGLWRLCREWGKAVGKGRSKASRDGKKGRHRYKLASAWFAGVAA
jgi:hypothetical protein